jgi:hypothetical protein
MEYEELLVYMTQVGQFSGPVKIPGRLGYSNVVAIQKDGYIGMLIEPILYDYIGPGLVNGISQGITVSIWKVAEDKSLTLELETEQLAEEMFLSEDGRYSQLSERGLKLLNELIDGLAADSSGREEDINPRELPAGASPVQTVEDQALSTGRQVAELQVKIQTIILGLNEMEGDKGLTRSDRERIIEALNAMMSQVPLILDVNQAYLISQPNPLVYINDRLLFELGADARQAYQQAMRQYLEKEYGRLSKAKSALFMGNAMVEAQQESDKGNGQPVKVAYTKVELGGEKEVIPVNSEWSDASIQRMVLETKNRLLDQPDRCRFVVNDSQKRDAILAVWPEARVLFNESYMTLDQNGIPILQIGALWNAPTFKDFIDKSSVRFFVTSGMEISFDGLSEREREWIQRNIAFYILNELLSTMQITKEGFEDQLHALSRVLQSA